MKNLESTPDPRLTKLVGSTPPVVEVVTFKESDNSGSQMEYETPPTVDPEQQFDPPTRIPTI